MAGKPKAQVDTELVRDYASIGCTIEEIAILCRVSEQTLYNREDILNAIKDGRENLKQSLRRMQLESARKGNTTMLIWLGKQLLNQRDRLDSDIKHSGDIALDGFSVDELKQLLGKLTDGK